METVTSPGVVGFVGLGAMGYPMAAQIAKKHALIAFNRTQQKAVQLKESNPGLNVEVADSVAEVLRRADKFVILSLFDLQSIQEVIFTEEAKPALQGKTIIQTSTISPDENLHLAAEICKCGGEYIECPVMGTNTVAQQAKLKVLVGCTSDQFQSAKDLLSAWGSVQYIGEIPKASSLKLAFNLLVATETAVFTHAVAMIEKQGISADAFMEAVRPTALYFPYMDQKLPRFLERDYKDPNFSVAGMHKDISLIVGQAKKLGIDTELLESTEHLFSRALQTHTPETDFTCVFDVVRNDDGSSTQQ